MIALIALGLVVWAVALYFLVTPLSMLRRPR